MYEWGNCQEVKILSFINLKKKSLCRNFMVYSLFSENTWTSSCLASKKIFEVGELDFFYLTTLFLLLWLLWFWFWIKATGKSSFFFITIANWRLLIFSIVSETRPRLYIAVLIWCILKDTEISVFPNYPQWMPWNLQLYIYFYAFVTALSEFLFLKKILLS